jgi:hypothetical protein
MKAAGPAAAIFRGRGQPFFQKHLFGRERSVSFADHAMMVSGIFDAVVENVAL